MKTIINIDASCLSDSACILRWYRTVVQGYREKVSSANIVYGSAVHKFVDMMYKTNGHIAQSRNAALEVFRKPKFQGSSAAHMMDEKHLIATCYNMWEEFIVADTDFETLKFPNGEPATEVTFSLPYMTNDEYDIRLTGTIDRIGKIRNGCYCIRDYKTTSSYKVDDYLNSYKLSKQLRFYALALRIMGQQYPESVLGQMGNTQLGARIDGIFLKSKPSDNIYKASTVFPMLSPDIDLFQSMLNAQISRLLDHLRSGSFQPEGIVNGTCDTKFKCRYWNVCCAPTGVQQLMLDRDFKQTHYNPLTFGEV